MPDGRGTRPPLARATRARGHGVAGYGSQLYHVCQPIARGAALCRPVCELVHMTQKDTRLHVGARIGPDEAHALAGYCELHQCSFSAALRAAIARLDGAPPPQPEPDAKRDRAIARAAALGTVTERKSP